MFKLRGRLALAVLLSGAAWAAPARADVTVGVADPNAGFCFPFGCGYTGEYQQVYGSTAFSGPITINTVEFLPRPDADLVSNTSSYTLAFYLTNKPINGLSTTPGANETTLLSTFGTFVPGTNYAFTGNTFTYDPALGNLLVSILTSGSPNASNAMYFSSATADPMSNLYRTSGTGAFATSSNGLVTRFSEVSAVPESSTWAMMLVGFGLIGFAVRRRNALRTGLAQIA